MTRSRRGSSVSLTSTSTLPTLRPSPRRPDLPWTSRGVRPSSTGFEDPYRLSVVSGPVVPTLLQALPPQLEPVVEEVTRPLPVDDRLHESGRLDDGQDGLLEPVEECGRALGVPVVLLLPRRRVCGPGFCVEGKGVLPRHESGVKGGYPSRLEGRRVLISACVLPAGTDPGLSGS